MDNEGYIIAQKPGTTITNLDGVFAQVIVLTKFIGKLLQPQVWVAWRA